MAEGKKSFLLYADVNHTVKHLTEEQAGQLFKHILAYVNDEQPDTPDPIIKIAFEPIKQSLKRDLKKYETIREKRARAGRASAEARQEKSTKSTRVKSAKHTSTNPTVNDSDSVSDSVSVNVSSIDDDVLYNVDKLFEVYCQNAILVKAVIENLKFKSEDHLKERLTEFNGHLKSIGQYMKKWNDYTSHFKNWHKRNKGGNNNSNPTSNIAF
jgi:hypothetical protein